MKSLISSVLTKVVTRLVASASAGSGSCDIVLSSNGDSIVFPIVPANLPEITSPHDVGTFNGVNCNLSVIGNSGLKTVSFEGLMPINPSKYSFCRPTASTAAEIISFMENHRRARDSFRLVIVFNDGSTYINMACLVTSWKYFKDNVNDYHYNIELVEYPMIGIDGQVHS